MLSRKVSYHGRTVDGSSVPDQNDGAYHVTQKMAEERHNLCRANRSGPEHKIQLSFLADRRDSGEFGPRHTMSKHGRLSLRRPSTNPIGKQREAALVCEQQGGAQA